MRCEATIRTNRSAGGGFTRPHLAPCQHPARYRTLREGEPIFLCGKHARAHRWADAIEWQKLP